MPDLTISADVLALLRCPMTGQPLRQAQRHGQSVLVSQDGKHVYAIRGGIPVLLPDTDPSNKTADGTADGTASRQKTQHSNTETSR